MVTMAKKVGCTQPYISMLERGEATPKFDTVLAIMKVYDLKWPETKEYLTKAILNFPKMHIPIRSRMFPEPMLKNLMATILAVYYDTSPNQIQKSIEVYKILSEMKDFLKKTIETQQRL